MWGPSHQCRSIRIANDPVPNRGPPHAPLHRPQCAAILRFQVASAEPKRGTTVGIRYEWQRFGHPAEPMETPLMWDRTANQSLRSMFRPRSRRWRVLGSGRIWLPLRYRSQHRRMLRKAIPRPQAPANRYDRTPPSVPPRRLAPVYERQPSESLARPILRYRLLRWCTAGAFVPNRAKHLARCSPSQTIETSTNRANE